MSNSNVPGIAFEASGLVIPSELDVLAGTQADINAAFGGNLNPSLSTPQGQLASSMAAIIAEKNAQFAYYVNQIDPATASGRMQDAIGRLYFMDRLPATPTTAQVLCTGLPGVVIPQGSLVLDASGNQYASLAGATISSGGNVTIPFAALNSGPITCPAGAITRIYKTIPGWDTATNPTDGVAGANVESRADFEYRRQQSVALNAVGSLPSIYANVFDVDGVSDVYVLENTTLAPITVGSITLAAKSIYVAAVGGKPADIAMAIWKKKSVGASYTGNTSVTVADPSGYALPYPTYTVKYQIPAAQPILFAVQLANLPTLPADIVARVKAAIINAFSGGDGGSRARVGATLYASRFYAPVSAIDPASVEILSIQIGTSSANSSAVTVDVGSAPTLNASNISVSLV